MCTGEKIFPFSESGMHLHSCRLLACDQARGGEGGGSGCKGEKRDLCPSMCFFLFLVTVPEVFAKVNSAQVFLVFKEVNGGVTLHFSLLVKVDTTASPALYIVFLLLVQLFEIYRFIMKMFTHIPNNR